MESATLTLRSLSFVALSEVTICGVSERGEARGSSQGVTLLMVSGSRCARCRWVMASAELFPAESSVEDEARMKSSLTFVLARLSISLRMALIHASISSALSRTSKKLVAAVLTVAFCVRSRERREFFGPVSKVPSSCAWLEICKTQCLPGMRSHAKAADSLPSLSTFSGARSKLPSPAYCKTYPEATKM